MKTYNVLIKELINGKNNGEARTAHQAESETDAIEKAKRYAQSLGMFPTADGVRTYEYEAKEA